VAFTQTDLDNLERAIAEGVTSVTVNGRTVSYRSLEEMQRTRDLIRGELSLINNSGLTYQNPKHSKGLR